MTDTENARSGIMPREIISDRRLYRRRTRETDNQEQSDEIFLKKLVDKLNLRHELSREEWAFLIRERTTSVSEYIFQKARSWQQKYYGNKIYVRGLIEMSSYCKNNCIYCGIRRGNNNAQRYRLSKAEILKCCDTGYELGYRTFVLQGGEDPFYSDEAIADIVSEIKRKHPDCAVTLSLGEKERDTYQMWFDAGADRYLLRHETANFEHYHMLHPPDLSPEHRQNCLWNLKDIGYAVGTGFMVGSPYQTPEYLADDMIFIHELQPQMVGIGPFVPHHDTPFRDEPAGATELTIYLLGLIRLMMPNVLIPATTALGTVDPLGREKGVKAGANVIMPNLSPGQVRKKYMLYDNKICTGEEAAECRYCLQNRMKAIGYDVVIDRGDCAAADPGDMSA